MSKLGNMVAKCHQSASMHSLSNTFASMKSASLKLQTLDLSAFQCSHPLEVLYKTTNQEASNT